MKPTENINDTDTENWVSTLWKLFLKLPTYTTTPNRQHKSYSVAQDSLKLVETCFNPLVLGLHKLESQHPGYTELLKIKFLQLCVEISVHGNKVWIKY